LLDVIASGDQAAAARAMKQHVEKATRRIADQHTWGADA
jgi:DNA-binding FadR family transcriptional regulator